MDGNNDTANAIIFLVGTILSLVGCSTVGGGVMWSLQIRNLNDAILAAVILLLGLAALAIGLYMIYDSEHHNVTPAKAT